MKKHPESVLEKLDNGDKEPVIFKMRRAGDGFRPSARMKYPPANRFKVVIPEFVTRTGFVIPRVTIKNPYKYYWALQNVFTGWVLRTQLRELLLGQQCADHDANALEDALKAAYGGDGTLQCSLRLHWCAAHEVIHSYGEPMHEERVRAAWVEYALGTIWEAFGAPRWREVKGRSVNYQSGRRCASHWRLVK